MHSAAPHSRRRPARHADDRQSLAHRPRRLLPMPAAAGHVPSPRGPSRRRKPGRSPAGRTESRITGSNGEVRKVGQGGPRGDDPPRGDPRLHGGDDDAVHLEPRRLLDDPARRPGRGDAAGRDSRTGRPGTTSFADLTSPVPAPVPAGRSTSPGATPQAPDEPPKRLEPASAVPDFAMTDQDGEALQALRLPRPGRRADVHLHAMPAARLLPGHGPASSPSWPESLAHVPERAEKVRLLSL